MLISLAYRQKASLSCLRAVCAVGTSLQDAMQPMEPKQRQAALTFEMSFGTLSRSSGAWLITHSTLPGRSGCHLLDVTLQQLQSMFTSGCKLHAGAFCPAEGWQMLDADGLLA